MTKPASTNQIELPWYPSLLTQLRIPVRRCIHLLQSHVLSSGTPGDDLGDEDAGVLPNMRIVCPSSNAEPKPRVPLKDMVSSSANMVINWNVSYVCDYPSVTPPYPI